MNKFIKRFNLIPYIIMVSLLLTSCNYSLQSKVIIADTENTPNPLVVQVKNGDDIQQKLNMAKDGSEIVIASGRYLISKPIDIIDRKNITITGKGVVWVESKRTDHQIFLIENSSDIILRNIKAQHILESTKSKNSKPLDDNRKGSVVDVEESGKVTFDNCELVGCGIYGIFSFNNDEINILKCYLHHNSLKALSFINKKGETQVLIRNSKIVNNADFIFKEGKIYINMAQDNIIENNNQQGYLDR